MDKLRKCAESFNKLADVQYKIMLGRKGKVTDITVEFKEYHFHHLMGLGKLIDVRSVNQNRSKVLRDIIAGKITYDMISKSSYIYLIENRFTPLANIESLFDSNELIFRYNAKGNNFSVIQADYLLSTPFEGNDIYTFIAKNNCNDLYYCRSFFPKANVDYTRNQPRYTLLFKEKVNLSTGMHQVQYDKLR